MLTSERIKQAAYEAGADKCGINEIYAPAVLYHVGKVIEDAGYEAVVYRNTGARGAVSDMDGSPGNTLSPEEQIEVSKHAKGKTAHHRSVQYTREVSPDMPLAHDKPFEKELCDRCGKCRDACPGAAITEQGVDSWQCSVYYRGAHKSNPFMKEDFLKDCPDREAILNGEKHFDRESAREIYPELKFLPATHFGYVPCLCGKRCETFCTADAAKKPGSLCQIRNLTYLFCRKGICRREDYHERKDESCHHRLRKVQPVFCTVV